MNFGNQFLPPLISMIWSCEEYEIKALYDKVDKNSDGKVRALLCCKGGTPAPPPRSPTLERACIGQRTQVRQIAMHGSAICFFAGTQSTPLFVLWVSPILLSMM